METSSLLLFATLVLVGSAGGWLARKVRLPALCGQIVVGVLLGEAVLNIIPPAQQEGFTPLITLALSLVAVTIGGHLEFRRLHNAARRIIIITLVQGTVTFAVTFTLLSLLNPLNLEGALRFSVHLILASIATSTSPVSTIHIIKEQSARGLLVKTTIGVIAVSNLLTIALFEVLRATGVGMLTAADDSLAKLLAGLGSIAISLALGAVVAWGLVTYCRRLSAWYLRDNVLTRNEKNLQQASMFTGFLVAMCLAAGLCEYIESAFPGLGLHPSPILANMMMGLILANLSTFKEDLLSLFDVLEHVTFTAFFVLAGAHFDLHAASTAWYGALIFFAARFVSKIAGGGLGGLLSGASRKMSTNIGSMLLAQGAIAIALVFLVERDLVLGEVAHLITATVLTAVVAAELISAPIIGWRLKKAGEAGQDRTRLIEFLQEEFIVPNMNARDKWHAIEQLCYFLARVHRLQQSPQALIEAVKDREQEMSTAIGHGIAVPHARISEGNEIFGTLALLDPPLDFDSPDGEPVRLVVLIATPEDLARKHLEVIAAITRMMSTKDIRDALFNARTAEEIHEVIDSQEAETFNYFLDA